MLQVRFSIRHENDYLFFFSNFRLPRSHKCWVSIYLEVELKSCVSHRAKPKLVYPVTRHIDWLESRQYGEYWSREENLCKQFKLLFQNFKKHAVQEGLTLIRRHQAAAVIQVRTVLPRFINVLVRNSEPPRKLNHPIPPSRKKSISTLHALLYSFFLLIFYPSLLFSLFSLSAFFIFSPKLTSADLLIIVRRPFFAPIDRNLR